MFNALAKILERINRPIGLIGSHFAGMLLALMTLIVLASVGFRYILGSPFAWSDELSRFLMIYMTYACLPIIYQENKNIAMTFLLDRLIGTRLLHIAMASIHIISIALFSFWIKYGMLFFHKGAVMADSLPVPMYYVYIVPPLLMSLTILSMVQMLFNELGLLINYKKAR